MTDIQDEVKGWLHSQQDWLQEAADRILEKGQLDDNDIQELSDLLKSDDGRKITSYRDFTSLGTTVTSTDTLRLVSIGEVVGMENLSPRIPLSFGGGNLAVIYGNNGSGKSSYTRILKKISGKPRAQRIRPNVFGATTAEHQCDITFSVDGSNYSVTWPANSQHIDELSAIDIFDGDNAGFYLSDETEATYTPPLMVLFESLAVNCKKVERILQYEQNQLITKLPPLPFQYSNTRASKLYQKLWPVMPEAVLKSIIEWNDEEQKSLDQLTERLKISDPVEIAKQKRAKATQIVEMTSMITKAAEHVSEESCKQLQNQNQTANDKRRQAVEAARVNTDSAKFDGIGTDTWLSLWKAAKSYSSSFAYQEKDFPVTDDDARCVLCHQLLDEDSKSRLNDFNKYVQGKIEAEAKLAEESYRSSIGSLPIVLTQQQLLTSYQAAGLNEEWQGKITNYWNEYQGLRELCVNAAPDAHINGLNFSSDLLTGLQSLSETLGIEASQHDADAAGFDRAAALNQKLDLEAKKWTALQAAAIKEETVRLAHVRNYRRFIELTNTRSISVKAGEFSQRIITDAYAARFNEELKALGATRIKVELIKTRAERGKVKHRLQLSGVTAGNASPNTILSDGERRVVALAAFLADVTGKPAAVPFVFDDPISSLDQDFEWEVAVRLANLAQDRQVIVFTHRLSLYGAMEDAARKCGDEWKRKNLGQFCIERFGGTSGHPVDGTFWNANTKKANNLLINRLDDAKKYWDAGDSVTYAIHAQGICTDFRKLVERTVEEDLLNQIIKRHRRSVTTDNRIIHLPKITKDDCDYIDSLMTKYSSYEHSQSHETPTFIPEEPELRQDIETLKAWREDFVKRPVEGT